jgi:hypothetical protein
MAKSIEGMLAHLGQQKGDKLARYAWERMGRAAFSSIVASYNLNAPWVFGQDLVAVSGDMSGYAADSPEVAFYELLTEALVYWGLTVTMADMALVMATIGGYIIAEYPEPTP